jgi:Tfp pilus assembly protein PilN
MSDYINKFNSLISRLEKAGKYLWKYLTFSLADNFFSFSKVISISIEANGIYLVYGTKALWKIKIESFRRFPLEADKPSTPEYLASAVAKYVDETEAAKAKIVLCIPRSWTIVQVVEFPIAVKESLANVISYELDRLTPLTPDNAYYDFKIIAEHPEKISILLAVAKKDLIDSYVEAFRVKKINIRKIGISTQAIGSLLKSTYKDIHTLFVSLNEYGYESGVIVNNFTIRSISGKYESPDAPDLDKVVRETYPLIDLLTKSGHPVKMVINAREYEYREFLQKLSNRPLFNLDRDVKFNLPKGNKDLSYFAVGGLIETITAAENEMNLLSKNDRPQKKAPLFLTASLFVLIFLIGMFYFIAPVQIGQERIEEIDRQITTLKPEMKKVEALKKEADTLSAELATINHFKKQRVPSLNILREMTSLLPEKTWLTHIKIMDTAIEIDGFASSATEIIPRLENSKYFQRVEFASPTLRDPRRNNEHFVIKMELRGENKSSKPEEIMKKNEKKK